MGYRRYNEVFIDVDGKKIKLFNSYGFFAAEYVKHSKLPDYRMSENWLSKSQCKLIKKPVGEEELIDGIVGFARAMHGYYGLYYRELTDEDKEILKKKRS